MAERRKDLLQQALISETMRAAGRLFPQAQIHLLEDPAQPGALTVAVDNPAITLQGMRMIRDFAELAAGADMVSIASNGDRIRLELVFCHALPRASQP